MEVFHKLMILRSWNREGKGTFFSYFMAAFKHKGGCCMKKKRVISILLLLAMLLGLIPVTAAPVGATEEEAETNFLYLE